VIFEQTTTTTTTRTVKLNNKGTGKDNGLNYEFLANGGLAD